MNTIISLLDSKKFIGALVTMISAVAIRLGIPEVQIEEILVLISPMLTYIGAQGFADGGKEAAKVTKS
jgi:hypothetical protein